MASSLRPRSLWTSLAGLLVLVGLAGSPAWAVVSGDSVEMSPAANSAIKRGLAWLAETQRHDGSWPGGYGGTTGIVAACTLALMGAGQLPDRGEYGDTSAKAVHFLVSCAQPNGLLYREGMQGAPMYHHGLATLALAEIWGATQDKKLRDVLRRAVGLILATQNQQGGWRYQPRMYDADLSVTVMQLLALRAAKDAGIFVPKDAIDLGIAYVLACHNDKAHGKDGGFAYQPGQGSGFARTGAGVLSLQVAGNYRASAVQEGVEYLLQFQPVGKRPFERENYFYGQYYAAFGIYQAQSAGAWGREAWRAWYPAITSSLIHGQQADGHWQGDFDQYPTDMSLLVLEIPFRYLPVYQR